MAWENYDYDFSLSNFDEEELKEDYYQHQCDVNNEIGGFAGYGTSEIAMIKRLSYEGLC